LVAVKPDQLASNSLASKVIRDGVPEQFTQGIHILAVNGIKIKICEIIEPEDLGDPDPVKISDTFLINLAVEFDPVTDDATVPDIEPESDGSCDQLLLPGETIQHLLADGFYLVVVHGNQGRNPT